MEDGVDATGQPHPTCCPLTTAANATCAAIHHRMPVVLTPEEQVLWLKLEETRPQSLLPLLHPEATHYWRCTPVNPKVNSWRWDVPEALHPYSS